MYDAKKDESVRDKKIRFNCIVDRCYYSKCNYSNMVDMKVSSAPVETIIKEFS